MGVEKGPYIPCHFEGETGYPVCENLYKSFPNKALDSISQSRRIVYNSFMRYWCAVGVVGEFIFCKGESTWVLIVVEATKKPTRYW